MFGDEVAERVGPIWGIGDDGELCNMYARTAQEGLYIAGGGIPGARAYSQYTAFLIKAAVEGLLPYQQSTSQSKKPFKGKPEPMRRECSETIT